MPCDIELHLNVATPISAVELIAANCELSRTRIKRVMQCGAVWLTRRDNTRRLRRASSELQTGDILHLYYDAATIDSKPLEAQLIADEGEYSAWYKPSGMFTQGTKWGDHHTIGRWAEQHLQPARTAKIVHRLDRHTSGVILLAHSKNAAAKLSELFRQRAVEKHYYAIVAGQFAEQGAVQRIETSIDDKPAVSIVTVLETSATHSLLDVKIETGRKHQVRRHLAESGFAIIGDNIYGEPNELGLQLCSVSIAFECPISQQQKLFVTAEKLRPSLRNF